MIAHSKPTEINFNVDELNKIAQSGMLVGGEFEKQASENLSRLIEVKNVQLVNSGTSALITAIIALQLAKKSYIAIPDNTCSSVYFAVKNLGHIPVICDIYEHDLSINIDSLSAEIIQKLKAIIVVHPYGLPIDLQNYKKYKLPIIEDCATSIGAEINGKKVGSMGDISVFSFYATKMLTSAEGGAVATNNSNYFKIIEEIVSSDMPKKTKLAHFNFKFTEIQAVLLNSQLEKLPEFIKKRNNIASFYNENIKNNKINIELNISIKNTKSVNYRYLIKLKNKQIADNFIEYSKQSGVVSIRPAYQTLNQIFGENANVSTSKKIYEKMISVPIYPSLSNNEQKKIVEMINNF